MSERDAFGPNLRRIRMQRGISVLDIVARTNVNAALWEGLERNDLSRWPKGIYARAYVRSYANAIGVDPESTGFVDGNAMAYSHEARTLLREPVNTDFRLLAGAVLRDVAAGCCLLALPS